MQARARGPLGVGGGGGGGHICPPVSLGVGGAALTEVVWEGSLRVLHIPETPAPSRQDGP